MGETANLAVKLYSFDPQRADVKVASVRDKVSEAEWNARVDLAAFCRLAAHFSWDDLLFTHISARVPDEPGHFLITPFGYLYDEITASHLIKLRLDGAPVEGALVVNPTGELIHGAIFEARPDVNWIMHTHVADIIAVSSQKQGLLAVTEHTAFAGHIAYHDWLPPIDQSVTRKLANDLGDKSTMLLRNHGSITTGASVGACFFRMRLLANACTFQVRAQMTGAELVYPDADGVRELTDATTKYDDSVYEMAWMAMRRLADRIDPGYAQ